MTDDLANRAFTPEVAAVALQFLDRAQITGAEVPAFVRVRSAIEVIARGGLGPEARPGANGLAVEAQP